MGAFHAILKDLCSQLIEGKNMVFHCIGGIGRTGTVAASMLVLLGYTAPIAIEATRSARRFTIANRKQEKFVSDYEQFLKSYPKS